MKVVLPLVLLAAAIPVLAASTEDPVAALRRYYAAINVEDWRSACTS